MAAQTIGTAHIYGIGDTVTNVTISDISDGREFATDIQIIGQDGTTSERRRNGIIRNITVTGHRQSGHTIPVPALSTGVTIAGASDYAGTYQLVDVQSSKTAGDSAKVTLVLRSDEGLTP